VLASGRPFTRFAPLAQTSSYAAGCDDPVAAIL